MSRVKRGDVFTVNGGGSLTVLKYVNYYEVEVEFNDEWGYKTSVRTDHLKAGKVRNNYSKTVHGVGYLGVGSYRSSVGGNMTPNYLCWSEMIRRCYDAKFHARSPTYRDVEVCGEWHNFQVFAEWFNSQPNAGLVGFQLDKDLRIMGSRLYSPETCSFVPNEINSLLGRGKDSIDGLPQGVFLHKKIDKYAASLTVNGKNVYLGIFSTAKEASCVYRSAKESNVREMATTYKSVIHKDVFENLMNWCLED